MSESCGGNCSSCSEACSERKPESLQAQPNPKSKIGKVIAVVSGKGGVGKSTVSAMLATAMQRTGRRVGVLDADITGPSIPKAFGVSECASADEEGIYPAVTESGIQIMSVNLLLEHEDDPVLWRGPIIAGAVKQFWTDVVWENVDYLFVDMPPGTGDVPLTVFQSLPLDGIVIVTSPQELVSMIVSKAANMASLMNIRVLGLVENMSYVLCPDCGKHIDIFGEGKTDAVAAEFGFDLLARIPLDARLAALCDKGALELMENDYINAAADKVESL